MSHFVTLLLVYIHLSSSQNTLQTLQEAIAKNNDVIFDSVSQVMVVNSPHQIRVTYTMEAGREGKEVCSNIYTEKGELIDSKCELENSTLKISLKRIYKKSKLESVHGVAQTKNQKTGLVENEVKILDSKDANIPILSRPYVQISAEVLKSLPDPQSFKMNNKKKKAGHHN